MLAEKAIYKLSFYDLMNKDNKNLHGGNLISNINKIIFDYVGYNNIDNYTPHHYANNENQNDYYRHNQLVTDFENSLNLTDKSFIYSIRSLFTEIKGIEEQHKYIDFGLTENCFEGGIQYHCNIDSKILFINECIDKLDNFNSLPNQLKDLCNSFYIIVNDKEMINNLLDYKLNENYVNSIIENCKGKNLYFVFQLDNNQKPTFESNKVLLKNGYSNLFENVIFSDKFYSMKYESTDTLKQVKRIAR